MQRNEGDALLLKAVTKWIIGCAFRVANALGHGFGEKGSEMPLPTRRERLGAVRQWESWSFTTTSPLVNTPPT
jgi:hypothetical protein